MQINILKCGLLYTKEDYSLYSKPFYEIMKYEKITAEYKKIKINKKNINTELSRMFTNFYYGYTVATSLQEIIIPWLDKIDKTGFQQNKINTIVNCNGILEGKFIKNKNFNDLIQKQSKIWITIYNNQNDFSYSP